MLEERSDGYAEEEEEEEKDHRNVGSLVNATSCKSHVLNRLVYKLVRVGDDGSVLPAAEEDYTNKNPESEICLEKEIASSEERRLEAERTQLLARLKVLDAILLKERVGETENSMTDGNLLPKGGSRVYKRRRRPSCKFSNDAKTQQQVAGNKQDLNLGVREAAEEFVASYDGRVKEDRQQSQTSVELLSDAMITYAKVDEIVRPNTQVKMFGEVVGDRFGTRNREGKRKRKPNRRYIEDEVDNLYLVSSLQKLISDGNDSAGFEASDQADSGSNSDYHDFHTRRSTMKRKADRKASKVARLALASPTRKCPLKGLSKKEKISVEKDSADHDGVDYDQIADCDLEFSGDQVETIPTPNGGTRRKHHRPWTLREVMILIEGVARCGGGKWADIKKLEFSTVTYRTAVDLKDKWRNLLRASRVHLSNKQSENCKKHIAVSIPQPILARVRELAAMQNQHISMPIVTRTRSGRTLRKK